MASAEKRIERIEKFLETREPNRPRGPFQDMTLEKVEEIKRVALAYRQHFVIPCDCATRPGAGIDFGPGIGVRKYLECHAWFKQEPAAEDLQARVRFWLKLLARAIAHIKYTPGRFEKVNALDHPARNTLLLLAR